KRGRLERLARLLLGQPDGSELAQFVVDEREQLLRGARAAVLDGGQDLRDVSHAAKHTLAERAPRPETGHRPAPPAPGAYPAAMTPNRSAPRDRCPAEVQARLLPSVRTAGCALRCDRRMARRSPQVEIQK